MNEKLTLTELQLIIKDSLYMALPDMYWVIAEISEIKENYSGHCYLELVEKHPDETKYQSPCKSCYLEQPLPVPEIILSKIPQVNLSGKD